MRAVPVAIMTAILSLSAASVANAEPYRNNTLFSQGQQSDATAPQNENKRQYNSNDMVHTRTTRSYRTETDYGSYTTVDEYEPPEIGPGNGGAGGSW